MPKPIVISTPESERHESAIGVIGASVETVVKRPRRTFSVAERLRIVKKAEACVASGERGALEAMLRAEGIYSSLFYTWRAQFRAGAAAGLQSRKPGRTPKLGARERVHLELEKRNAELERKLHVATAIIELQKKAHELLGLALPASDGEA